jgi:hypothetical protein
VSPTKPAEAVPKPPPIPHVSETLQPSELPKPTDSGKEPSAALPKHEPPRDLGRGGAQHRAIQERIQAEAHALGFLAEIERQLAGQSNEAADLVVRKGDFAVAVEISVTTTVDHEFGNVKKCLSAGFTRVAVVSPKPEHLKAIGEAVRAGLGHELTARASFHSPDEFISELSRLAQQAEASAQPPTPQESVSRGYKVRRQGPSLTSVEHKAKEDGAIRVIAETMKRRP